MGFLNTTPEDDANLAVAGTGQGAGTTELPKPGFWVDAAGSLAREVGGGAASAGEALGDLLSSGEAVNPYTGQSSEIATAPGQSFTDLAATGGQRVQGGAPMFDPDTEKAIQKLRDEVTQYSKLDPRTTGAFGMTVGPIAKGLTEAGIGSVAGPWGAAALMGGASADETYHGLVAQGVDEKTATEAATAQGVFSGVGAFLPLKYGSTAVKSILGGAGVNLGFGIVDRAVQAEALKANGYGDMANQVRPFAFQSMFADAVLGAAFGTMGHYGPALKAKLLSMVKNPDEAPTIAEVPAPKTSPKTAIGGYSTTGVYDVSTLDAGKLRVRVMRNPDGGAAIFDETGEVPPIEMNAAFANGKSDADLIKYQFEPLGYEGHNATGQQPLPSEVDAASAVGAEAHFNDSAPGVATTPEVATLHANTLAEAIDAMANDRNPEPPSPDVAQKLADGIVMDPARMDMAQRAAEAIAEVPQARDVMDAPEIPNEPEALMPSADELAAAQDGVTEAAQQLDKMRAAETPADDIRAQEEQLTAAQAQLQALQDRAAPVAPAPVDRVPVTGDPIDDQVLDNIVARYGEQPVRLLDGRTVTVAQHADELRQDMARATDFAKLHDVAVACFLRSGGAL